MKENNKIGILIDNISNSGGTERVASILSSGLINSGYDVSIFSLFEGSSFFPMHDSIKYWESKGAFKSRIAKIFEISRFVQRNKFKALLIISMGKLSFQSLPILKCLANSVKVISCDHVSIESFNKTLRILKCYSYSLADEVCVLTDYDKDFMLCNYKVNNINVIRNISPYETSEYIEKDLLNKDKTVIAVGRLTHQKNFKRLIDIWSNAETDDWTLHIVGTGEELEMLSSYIGSKKLEGSIKLIGECNNMEQVYQNASILCMTSRYEGLPMVLIECKNFGVPAISFDCKTGPQELIDNDGYLIPYDDDAYFSKKIGEMISDNNLRFELSKKALMNSDNYTSSKIIPQWIELIEK